MTRSTRLSATILVCSALLLWCVKFVVVSYILPTSKISVKLRKKVSEHQLIAIASYVEVYKSDNEYKLPPDLNALESYAPERDIFLAPSDDKRVRLKHMTESRARLNDISDYILAVNPVDTKLIVYERPGMWGDDIVAACFEKSNNRKFGPNNSAEIITDSDFEIQHLREQDLAKHLKSK